MADQPTRNDLPRAAPQLGHEVSLATVPPQALSESKPNVPASDDEPTDVLTAARSLQLEAQQKGKPVLAETFRESFPALHRDQEAFQELLVVEIAFRESIGESPSLGEYLQRLPEMEDWLRQHFAALEAARANSANAPAAPDGSIATIPPPRRPEPAPAAPEPEAKEGGATANLLPRQAVTQRRKVERGMSASIPGYQILGELGRGGMGVVYKAKQLGLSRMVALKMVIGGAHVGQDELARFRIEAMAVARLKHPNIVQIYDIGVAEGLPFFSLEYVDGGTLTGKMAGNALPDAQAAGLIELLARAMHSAHEAGIIHRDLKPANVLLAEAPPGSANAVAPFGIPKITDFGLAKRLESEDGQTQTGMIMGTPSYMAPEQAGAESQLGPAADIYSLGAILYEMITGRQTFKGTTVWETLEQVRFHEPLPPSRLQPKVARDLETICLKCLEKDPQRRYATAEALADDLRRFRQHEPIQARPAGRIERAVKWARRRPKEASLLGLSAALLLSLVGGFIAYHIYLEIALNEARAEVAVAKERERLESVRAEAQDFLSRGRGAFQAGDLATAKLQIGNAQVRVDAEPGLADLRPQVDALAGDAARFEQFGKDHDEALFHATLFTGLDTAANLTKTQEAARRGLDLYGVRLNADAPPVLDGTQLTAAQKAQIAESCYELLLVLADATAYPLPDDTLERRKTRATAALPILDRAAKLGVSTRAYHVRRARYLRQQGDEPQAAAERAKAQAMQPTSAVDSFLVGEDATKRGDHAQAQRDFERALDQQPGHYWAQYYHAIGCLRQQRAGEARAGLTACISRRPDFVWSYLMRGLAHGELGKATANETGAAAEFAAAEADFQRVLDRKPDPVTLYGLYANRGVMRIRQGKLAEAVADLRQAVEIKPSGYQAYVNLAQAFQTQRQYQEAVAELTKAIERDPRQAQVYRFRAQLHLEQKELDAALADFEKAIQHEPADTRSLALAEDHVGRGKIYQQKNQHQKAVAAFDEALRQRVDYVPAHRLRAESLLLLNRLDDAIVSLDICLQKEKPSAAVYRARAQARAKLGRLPEAVEDYTRALDLEPDPIGYTQRGWSYLLVYDAPKLALRDFEAALKLDAKLADAYNGRGTCRALLGAYQLAATDADEAVRRAAETPRLIYKSARVYALAVAKLDPEAAKGDRKAVELRTQYLDRAQELLKETFRLLPGDQRAGFWKELVENDTALASVRRSPGYLKLQADYGKGK